MSTHPHLSLIQTITRNLGITVTPDPSVEHPIPVPLFFRNNPDGTLGWLWPKGSRLPGFPGLPHIHLPENRWKAGLQKTLFTLGLTSFVAHGRLVVYTDVPTATYLQQQTWRRR